MASSFKLSFTAVLLCVAFSFCRGQGQSGGGGGGGGGAGAGAGAGGAGGGSGIGAVVPGTQDSVQIVAQAALCFDNKPVLNGCLQAMGINTSAGARPSMPAPGAQAIMCSPPCSGHVTMMMSCVNGIFGNFVSYNPGLMQGVQAVFQMSCGNGNGNGPGGAGGAAGGAGGAAGGAGGAGVGGGAGGAAGGAGGAAAGGMPNSIGGAGGAGTGIVGGAGGGVGVGPAGGAAGAMPNQIGGAAAGGGAGAGGAAGGGGTVSSVGGAAGGASSVSGGGNDTATDDTVGAITSGNATNVVALPPKPSAGSHVAVSNQSQPTTSGADGPTFSLKGACSSLLLVIWAGAWLPLLV
uniref:Uncharacterized protein n=2 Tax=Avena sativa TaxID=4498 RepID=A0ACD5U3Q4_AVESA